MKFYERPVVHIFLIALLGLLAYSNTFDVPFQFDEQEFIENNPIVKDFSYFLEPSKAKELGQYGDLRGRYIGYLTFALNHKLHGFAVTGYHIVNLALHIVNALLVYLLTALTFKTPFLTESLLKRYSGYLALFAGLLFISHPVQTGAVTYIYQRLASLVSFFYLGSTVFYIKWRLSPSPSPSLKGRGLRGGGPFYILSILFAVFAMYTKENAFTLPIAIAIYEFMFFEGQRLANKRIVPLVPYFLTMLIIPLTAIDFDNSLGVAVSDATRTQFVVSRHDYLLTQFRVIATYLRLLVFPVNQNLDYDYPIYNSFQNTEVLLSFLLLFSMVIFSIFLYRRARQGEKALRVVSFGTIWFFLTLSIESSLIVLADVIFEHRVYLPSAGLFPAVSAGVAIAVERVSNRKFKTFAIAVAIVLIAVFSYASYARNSIWGSRITLWEDVAKKSPGKPRVHYNLARHYLDQDRGDKAIEHFLTALYLNPYHIGARLGLGIAYAKTGQYVNAINQFKALLKMQPRFADAHYNLGVAYFEIGLIEDARREFESTLQIDPSYSKAQEILRDTSFQHGRN